MSIVQEHLSKDFFKNIIQKQFEDAVEILNIDASYVVPLGENYICELKRIVVDFINGNGKQSVSMIVKCLLENKEIALLEQEIGLHRCEMTFYQDIQPILEKLEFKKKVCPSLKCLSRGSKHILVIEDLSALNYKMASRFEGLDLEHCLLAIDKLAYFHASSLAIREKNPKTVEQFDKGVYNESKLFKNLTSIIFQETVNTCKRELNLQQYANKLSPNLLEKFYLSTKRDPKFNVLNHGDFWCNNMMFKYDANGRLEDVLFIDFQVTVFASPFYDLHYFIATTTNVEVLQNHIPTILSHYYNALRKYVKILKLKTMLPSREDFEKNFRDKAFIGMAAVCNCMPFCKVNKRKDANLADFLQNDGEGSFRQSCFNNSQYLTSLQCLLSLYDNIGLFES